MRYLLLIVLVITLGEKNIFSQNLVPNYSFENFTQCPNTNSGISLGYVPPWETTIYGSPDYFNACGTGGYSVPNNVYGSLPAHTGVAYAGIAVYAKVFPNTGREYLQVPLTEPLKIGKKYCAEFYVCLADSFQYAISEMSAYFSTVGINNNIAQIFSHSPQINNPSSNILSDRINWAKISGTFIADSAYKYITLGNFKDDANSDTVYGGGASDPSYAESYYYIDDVSVTCCDECCADNCDTTFYVPNAFSPNGDGENDVFKVNGKLLDELHCEIFNRWGQQVAELDLPNQGWDGRINGQVASTGVYFYYLTAKDKNGNEISKKGNVTLLR